MTHFGTTQSGDDVRKITLTAGDLTVAVLTWGAVIQDVRLADIDRSLTLGSERLSDYEGDMRHHGSLIGPIANRISNARVKIAGMMHELERNQDGRIHLHSGARSTMLRVWEVSDVSESSVTLSCHLPDGDCGLPGDRQITVTYALTAPATLTMTVTGTSDEMTAMNFANHSYWNLDGTPTWDGHTLKIAADRFLPSTSENFPTGEIVPTTGSQMDFTQPRTITQAENPFDNNFCLSDDRTNMRDVLWVSGASGVTMTVATTEPGIQVYDGRDAARPNAGNYEGLAIEAQFWPDAPNNRHFPSILMGPAAPYNQITSWRFTRDEPRAFSAQSRNK